VNKLFGLVLALYASVLQAGLTPSGSAGAYSGFNPAQFSFIMGGASGALTALGPLTDGQLLIGSTGVEPAASSLTGTANQITVTPGAGSITLSLPQSIATTNNVTFGSVTDSSLTAGRNTFAGTAGDLSDDGDWLFNTTGNVVTLTGGQMNVDSLRLDGDTLSNQGNAGDVVIQADPAGVGGRAKFTNGTSSEYYIGSNNPELKQMMLYPSFEESVAELQCDFCSGFTQQTSTGVEGELYGLFYARASYAGAATDTIYVMPGTNFDDDMPASVSCWINTARAGVTFRFSNTFDGDSDSQVVSSGGTWAKYTAQGTCRAGIGEGCGWKIVDNTSEAGVIDINGCSIELGNSGLDVVKTVGTPNGLPRFYSAKVSGAGVVTGEVGDFINGNCSVAASIATCTWTVGAFTTVANCVATQTVATARFMTADAATTTVSGTFKGWTDAGVESLNEFTLLCHGY